MGDSNETHWKSSFARRLASMKISEEYEYLAKIYEKLNLTDQRSSEALLYALHNASSSSPANKFRDSTKEVTQLPEGSKVCIIGAGMAGMNQSTRQRFPWLIQSRVVYRNDFGRSQHTQPFV